jgi:hypothetical protein
MYNIIFTYLLQHFYFIKKNIVSTKSAKPLKINVIMNCKIIHKFCPHPVDISVAKLWAGSDIFVDPIN